MLLSVPIWMRLWLGALFLLAVVFILQNSLVKRPSSIQTTHTPTGASINFAVHSTDCLDISWATEGIKSVLLDERGRVGQGSETICSPSPYYTPTLLVNYTDGTSQQFSLQYRSATLDLISAAAVGIAVGLLLAGTHALRSSLAIIIATLTMLATIYFLVENYLAEQSLFPVTQLSLHYGLTVSTAVLIVGTRHRPNWGATFGLVVLTLLPIAALYSIPYGLHAASVLPYAWVFVYGIPLLIAIVVRVVAATQIRQWFQNALTISLGIVFSVFVIEVALRIIMPVTEALPSATVIQIPSDDAGYGMQPNTNWYKEYATNPRDYFDEDNRIYYQTNATGFRDEPFVEEKAEDVVRVALVGDSFAMGVGVRAEDKVDVVMESAFAERYMCDVEIYNFSVGGNGTLDYRQVVSNALREFQPDVLLIWYFLNDIGINKAEFYEDSLRADNPFFPLGSVPFQVARLASQRLQQYTQAQRAVQSFQTNYADANKWGIMVDDLAAIAETTQAYDIPYGLFVHPVLVQLNGRYPYQNIHQRVIAEADSLGYFTHDLHKPLSEVPAPSHTLWVHPTDSHPNEVAHRITGDYAATQLLPYLPQCNT